VYAEIWLHRVDVTAVARVVADDAHGARRSERNVRRELRGTADSAVLNRFDTELGDRFADAEFCGVRDVTQSARFGSGTEQSALRSAQNFDTRQVEEIDIRCEERQRDHRFVEVDADLLLDARLVARDLS